MTGAAWLGKAPRRWQLDAWQVYLEHADANNLNGAAIYAATGSGKSIHLAEVIADQLERSTGKILVTTPTVALVEQLVATISGRLGQQVGSFYTDGKNITPRVVVACHDSMAKCIQAIKDARASVGFWLSDECHKTNSPTVQAAFADLAAAWPECQRFGYSATPYLSNHEAGLKLWDKLLFKYDPDDAIADGALVPWQRHGLSVSQAAAYQRAVDAKDAASADAVIDDACASFIIAANGPGVVSATSIADAENFAIDLADRGIAALAIHSMQPASVRAARLEALKVGKIKALIHVSLLVEGIDLPWLQFGVLRRPRARVGFVQEIGRFLRAAPGKTFAAIFDPFNMFETHGLTHAAALSDLIDTSEDEAEREKRQLEAGELFEILDPLTGKVYKIPADAKRRNPSQRLAVAHNASANYINEVVSRWRAVSILEQPAYLGANWRKQPASDKQIAWLTGKAGLMHVLARHNNPHAKAIAAAYRLIMGEHNQAIESDARAASPLRRGAVSDFLDALTALKVVKNAEGFWDNSRQELALNLLLASAIDAENVLTLAKAVKP